MKIALAQYNFTVADLEGNLTKILNCYQRAQIDQLDLIVFPELALSGYPPEDLLLRDDFLQTLSSCLAQLIQASGALPMIIGCPMQHENQLTNCALVIQNQKIMACYAKQCLPNYGVFDEKRYFTAGQKSCVFQLSPHGIKFGLLICEDVWHAEPAIAARQQGAEILLSIHASPFSIQKEQLRRQVYAAACKASDLPMLACFMVGAQDELCFDGGCRALDAQGHIIAQANFFTEELLVIDIEKNKKNQIEIRNGRDNPVTTELDDTARVYQALVLGVRDYVTKNNFKSVLLGLSGGIDSSLTLMLAIDALGVENVTAVTMPSRFTSELTMEAVQQQVSLTGVKLITLAIEPLFSASLETLAPIFAGLAPDLTEENLQARCRGMLLMALSNKMGQLVLTTGNKSEMAMGYATLYGDMAGSFAALKDVPKTLVFALARYRNRMSEKIPEMILLRPPSAELAFDQIDQDSLPPYDILDEILHRSIDLQQSEAEIIAAGFDAATVRKVVRAIYLNEYKRRQAPPGIKITEISFTRERRYPITGFSPAKLRHSLYNPAIK
jgi:NAD+ synthase (glutamine-hydrolysing)